MIQYRGYIIRQRIKVATSWILRPDGSWRYSAPTITDAMGQWLVLEPLEPGIVKEIGCTHSEGDARDMIDRLVIDKCSRTNAVLSGSC